VRYGNLTGRDPGAARKLKYVLGQIKELRTKVADGSVNQNLLDLFEGTVLLTVLACAHQNDFGFFHARSGEDSECTEARQLFYELEMGSDAAVGKARAVFDKVDFDANEMKDNQKKLQLNIEVKGYQIDSQGLVVSAEIGQCFSAQELVETVLEAVKNAPDFMGNFEDEDDRAHRQRSEFGHGRGRPSPQQDHDTLAREDALALQRRSGRVEECQKHAGRGQEAPTGPHFNSSRNEQHQDGCSRRQGELGSLGGH